MLTTTPATDVAKNKTSRTTSWVWLVELQVDGSTAVRVAADYDAQITHRGVVWYPLAVKISDLRRDADGRVGSATLTFSNIRRYFVGYLDADKVVGKRCRLIVLDVAQAADAAAGIEEVFTVNDLEIGENDATIRIGVANPLAQPFPRERFLRTYCRFLPEYGSASSRCGYDATLPGALSTCDGTLEGANGCRVHGANEVSRGLPSLHPLRYGAFPGIGEGPIEV